MSTIAIVGGGFSGSMLAVHLLRSGAGWIDRVALIERAPRFGRGVAYSTPCPQHLLNVPAGRMSAFQDDEDHFLRWARGQNPEVRGGTFVPRVLFGQYVSEVLDEAARSAPPDGPTLQRISGEAVAATQTGNQITLGLRDGATLTADMLVLAIGNFPPGEPPIPGSVPLHSSWRYIADPWAPGALESVGPDEPVLLIGTGLTMLDVAVALADRGHLAPMTAVSRRGLLPQPHRSPAPGAPKYEPPADIERWPTSARDLLRRLRDEVRAAAIQGQDWRDVLASLRPVTQSLWRKMGPDEQRRFLKHLRPYWDSHRHRAAPETARTIDRLIAAGRLRVMAARLAGLRSRPDADLVLLRPRGSDLPCELPVGRIINCTGPETDIARVRDPLVTSLRDAGLLRPDPLGLGVDADDTGALIGATGRSNHALYALGPLRRAQLWETTAVPELRVQASQMAIHLLGLVRGLRMAGAA